MERFMKRMENMFMAATFAEAGEFEEATNILRKNERTQKEDRIKKPGKELRAPGMRR